MVTVENQSEKKCPVCRHDFSNSFCMNIEANLEHKIQLNEGEPLQWMQNPNVRLAALNMLAKLPKETPLGRPVASALLWSSLDSSPGIPNAALSTERLSAAFEIVPEAERVVFIHAVLKSLKTAVDADGTVYRVYHMTRVIAQLSENDIGCLAVLEAGGCGAMVQALIVAKTDDVIGSIALAIKYLVASNDCGIRCFRQFSEHSVCSYLAAALAIVSDNEARLTITNCISLMFDTAALSVEDYSAHEIGYLKTLCSSKGISISGKKITKKELVARLSELGTIEQKKLLLRGSIDICNALFVAMSSAKTFSEETLLSLLEVMWAIICDNNSDGAAKMFHVNGISQAFTVVLNSSLHSNDVICSVGKVLAELLFHIGSASTTDCESFFECASHLGEALVSAWAHSKDDGTKQQISVAICDLSAAAQRFQGCQEIVEIKFCKNSSVPELDAALKLVLVAPHIDDIDIKKVIHSVVAKFVKGWSVCTNDPEPNHVHALRRWRQWAHLHERNSHFDDNRHYDEVYEKDDGPIVSEKQVLALVTALQKSKEKVEQRFNISLAIAIIANVPQCMDRFIQCARALQYNSQKTGSVASSDVFEAIWIGIVSASDRKEAKVCGRLCSYIGSTLFRPLRQGKSMRRGELEEGFVRESFLDSFTKLCSIRDSLTNNSFVCRSLIYALISSCSERRTQILDGHDDYNDESTTNIVQGIYFCIDNMWLGDDEGSSDDSDFERNLTLFDRDKQFRDALLTAVKSTRVTPEIINWSRITGGMVPRPDSRITTHRAVAKIIDSLNSQELFVSSLQAATSAEEKSRLAFSMAHCDLTRIKSSPACKEVIDALIGAPKHYKLFANECNQTYSFAKVKKVIVNAIQNLGGSHELIEHMPRSAAANEADDAPALVPLSAQPSAPNAATPRPSTSSSALEASTPSSARPRCAAAARGAFAALDDQIASSEDLDGSVSGTLPCAEAPPPARRGRPPQNAASAPSPSPLAAAVAFQAAQHEEAPTASDDGSSDVSGLYPVDNAAAPPDMESPEAAACPDADPALPTAGSAGDADVDVLTAANARGLDIFKLIDFWGPDGSKGQKSRVGTMEDASEMDLKVGEKVLLIAPEEEDYAKGQLCYRHEMIVKQIGSESESAFCNQVKLKFEKWSDPKYDIWVDKRSWTIERATKARVQERRVFNQLYEQVKRYLNTNRKKLYKGGKEKDLPVERPKKQQRTEQGSDDEAGVSKESIPSKRSSAKSKTSLSREKSLFENVACAAVAPATAVAAPKPNSSSPSDDDELFLQKTKSRSVAAIAHSDPPKTERIIC